MAKPREENFGGLFAKIDNACGKESTLRARFTTPHQLSSYKSHMRLPGGSPGRVRPARRCIGIPQKPPNTYASPERLGAQRERENNTENRFYNALTSGAPPIIAEVAKSESSQNHFPSLLSIDRGLPNPFFFAAVLGILALRVIYSDRSMAIGAL